MNLCTWMGFIIHFSFQLGRNLSVYGGSGEGAMTEEGLNGFEVHAVFQPMCGDGMADGVGG